MDPTKRRYTIHECHMCEACYSKVRAFIECDLKGKIHISDAFCVVGDAPRTATAPM